MYKYVVGGPAWEETEFTTYWEEKNERKPKSKHKTALCIICTSLVEDVYEMTLNKNIQPSTQTYQKQRKELKKDRKGKIIGYTRLQAFCPLCPYTARTMLEEDHKYESM